MTSQDSRAGTSRATSGPDMPVCGALGWSLTAVLRGSAGVDSLLDVAAEYADLHLVAGLPDVTGTDAGEGPQPLATAVGDLRRAGAVGAGLALPVEGDLVGLGGPGPFNLAAAEAGEALVLPEAGIGLVPEPGYDVLTWHAYAARPRQLVDLGEADRALRASLSAAADALVDLDVARWRPEVADELMDLRRPPGLEPPAGIPARCASLAGRSLTALRIVELALADDGAAVSATEAELRRTALLPLAAAGRRGLVAACSPEVWPPD